MKLIHEGGQIIVNGGRYVLEVLDKLTVRLSVEGRPFIDLRVVSAVDQKDGRCDLAENLSGPEVSQGDRGVRLAWKSGSSVWKSKFYVFDCHEDVIAYQVILEGQGKISALEYFSGAQEQKISSSLYHFSRFMTSEVSMLDRRYYKSFEYACIDAWSGQTSDTPREPEDNNHWLFTPPPFAYAWSYMDGPWLGVGLAPKPGQYNFTRFQNVPEHNCCKLRVTYDGMTCVNGKWESPHIIFRAADDEYAAIAVCVDYLYETGLAVRPKRHPAPWWSRPIFCGWGQQNMTWVKRGGHSNEYARQDVYTEFMSMLEDRGIYPGTIVIDDKWQKQYATMEPDPEKWPDLRGWIDGQHAKNRRVLLWYGAWTPEGLPGSECIHKKGSNEPICADPSNPAYQERLRRAVRQLLSDAPGCFNADGFKVDWTNGVPLGEGFELYGDIWGVELLKLLMSTIYQAAKQAKPDALIITHAANPYFAEVTDMLRLNDISAVQRDVIHIMRHRQKLALIANADWLIDCDNSSAPTHDEWLSYTKIQPELGVPSLYFITGVDGTGEPIVAEDWKQLPEVWKAPPP